VGKTLTEYLKLASDSFDAGELVRAGQIWQAILKKDSSVEEAKAGLLKVKALLSEDVGKEQSTPEIGFEASANHGGGRSSVDIESYLTKGRSLYDLGELQQALVAWEKVLGIDPSHQLALSYVRGVCKELGLPMPSSEQTRNIIQDNTESGDESISSPPSKPSDHSSHQAPSAKPDVDDSETASPSQDSTEEPSPRETKVKNLIQIGSKSYELGLYEGAIETWESALALEPDNSLIRAYLGMAQRDLERQNNQPGLAPQELHQPPSKEAEPKFPKLIDVPIELVRDKPVKQATKDSAQPVTPAPPTKPQPKSPSTTMTKAQMPLVITRESKAKRSGLSIPSTSKKGAAKPFTPILFVTVLGVILVFSVGLVWFRHIRKDAILRATQANIVDEVINGLRLANKVEDLVLTPQQLRTQAQESLRNNPLRAYLLAQEVIKRDPLDTVAARLSDQAQRDMAALPTHSATSGEISQHIASGYFSEAERLLEASLRKNPNDMRMRETLARVCLLMVRDLVKQNKWDDARSRLLMGAALFPNDAIWLARLKFLENLRSVPRDEQHLWIDLLG
jgi:tetratricopeptide (TPR) repeat protein